MSFAPEVSERSSKSALHIKMILCLLRRSIAPRIKFDIEKLHTEFALLMSVRPRVNP